MNKQEVIEKIKNISVVVSDTTIDYKEVMVSMNEVLNIINQLDEPEKPVVPKCVADWYEESKDYFDFNIYGFYKYFYSNDKYEEVKKWLDNVDNKAIETLVKMKLYGYGVKKEKLYTVELPNPNDHEGHMTLSKKPNGKIYLDYHFNDCWRIQEKSKLTEAEIREDFDWAWQFAEEVEE